MMKFNLKEFRERSGATDEATGEKNSGLPSISDVTIAKLGVKRMTLRDRVIFASKVTAPVGTVIQSNSEEKITLETACKLKAMLFGSQSIPPPNEWLKQGFILYAPEQLFSYGLKTPKNEVKNLLMCFQAYFLKNLLFGKKLRASIRSKDETKRKMRAAASKMTLSDEVLRLQKKGSLKVSQVMKPSEKAQIEMVLSSFTEILLRLSSGAPAVFCLPGPDNCFEPTAQYGIDGITEKLRIFRLANELEARCVIGKHLGQLMDPKGCGVLCMLYSMMLSRNFERMKKDLQDKSEQPLIDTVGECSQALINMVLVGVATPYIHNGTLTIEDDNGEHFERDGILARSDVGFLIWDRTDIATANYNMGSMLKTPALPIWLVKCNGKLGVLFNLNKELMKSHHAENRFQLYYYSDHEFKKGATPQETSLTIDTRTKVLGPPKNDQDLEEETQPPLELAIKTKWSGADISWGEIQPYVW